MKKNPLHYSEQPYDQFLLKKSRLYLRSRTLFNKQGGIAVPTLLSSPRSLSSAALIENKIEYSPLARELEWSCNDPVQKRDRKHFATLRTFVTSVFHEQNHRILWRHLIEQEHFCPQTREAAHRYLNLIESLIVILDFALGDELGLKTGRMLYERGVIYSPGSDFKNRFKPSRREYRNYLQAVAWTVYLRLEGLHPEDIAPAVYDTFKLGNSKHTAHAIKRAFLLDEMFINLTNPIWQRRHVGKVMQAFKPNRNQRTLHLPRRQPTNNLETYIIIESWLNTFNL